jgi:hypothetical protein
MHIGLDDHLQRLTDWFQARGPESLTWSEILLFDGFPAQRRLSRGSLYTPAEFSPRFDEYLSRGYSWLNLSAAGVWNDALLVFVEHPNEGSMTLAGHPQLTSINYSGPIIIDGQPQWRLSPLRFEIID